MKVARTFFVNLLVSEAGVAFETKNIAKLSLLAE
jgi:hypothetical protein